MPERPIEIHIQNLEVKSTTVYSVLDMYKALRFWLIENEYVKSKDTEFPEIYMWEQRTQNKGKEIWAWWRPKRIVAYPSSSSFIRRVLDIDIHGVGITDVEIMYKGQKVKAQKGKLEILIRVKLEIDHSNMWRSNKLMKDLLPWFWKRFWKRELEMYKRDVVNDAYRLQDFCKKYFKMPMLYQPDMKPHIPIGGYEEEQY